VGAFALLLHAGCGGSDAASPRSPAGGSAATLDGAMGDLDRAESELGAALGYQYAHPPGVGAPGAAQQPVQPGAAPAAPPPEPATPPPADASKRTELSSSDPCAIACRALDSMGKAAEHICGLAGDSDTRCEAARSRVQAATERVRARCTCG